MGQINPPHSYQVIPDTHHEGLWPTCRRALLSGLMDKNATHVMVLQDDMHPCRDFIPALEIILDLLPNHPIVMATSRKVAGRTEGSWCRTQDATWGGATILPKGLIKPFLDWERKYMPPSYYLDDGKIALYLLSQGILIWHTVPSLMIHLGNRSVIGHHHSNARIPKPSLTLDQSALSIDWTKGLEDPPTSGYTTQARVFIKTLPEHIQRDSGLGAYA
jgi:hypothetical protein